MSKEKFLNIMSGALKKFGQKDAKPPVELLDRPNGIVYPVFDRPDVAMPDFSAMAGSQHSPLGAMGMALGDEAMQQGGMGGGMEPSAPGAPPMADPMAAMMGGGAEQQPGLFEGPTEPRREPN